MKIFSRLAALFKRTSRGNNPETKRPGFWRQEVFARIRRLEYARPGAGSSQTQPVQDLLKVAKKAAKHRSGFLTWWNGTLEERAWLALHEAEVELLRTMKDKDAQRWWQSATGRFRPQAGTPLSALTGPELPKDAAHAADSLRSYYDWSDKLFAETRALRNRLILLTIAGLAATGMLLAAGSAGWLQIKSGQAATVAGPRQFLLVALFGAVGAFIAGVPALSAAVRSLPPYSTSPYQMALKLATGPIFALIGVLALARGFIDQVASLSQFNGTVLLWALIFGGTQQLLTRVLDRKAAILTIEHESRW